MTIQCHDNLSKATLVTLFTLDGESHSEDFEKTAEQVAQ
jgi:hypothetical protein